jgi:hypothetical protein
MMAYSVTNPRGQQYFLHQRDQILRGGQLQRIYFFAKELRPAKGTPIDAMPTGRVVVFNERTGLPVTKKG